ncbi:MAG: endonuclease/exonuclease/phosphatase family protein [Candidatus Poribacteria bacterium]|nr:endonuclease/exonuclease/phosphatase family protein [Candidatus Poribacteria bacterium]
MSKLKIVFLLFAILFAVSGCEKITDKVILPPDTTPTDMQPLTVMTYNVYVGGSADPLLSVENLGQVPGEVAKIYNNIMASDFPGRAVAIAKSIKTHQPHLIGLQEITLIRRQSPGDLILGGTVSAEEVILDFLKILMDALQAEGLNYQVAAQVENIDIEMPIFTDTGIDDVRLTDYNVILSRSDVEISNPVAANYKNALTIEMLEFEVKRGYAAVDATVAGVTYRVVNTHLEVKRLSEEKNIAQAQELIDVLSNETLPIILLGDFNTRATDGTGYQLLLSAGYVDVWQMDSEGTGNTCCQDDDILNEVSDLSVRIDQIFVRNMDLSLPVLSFTVGDKPADRLPSGLWPSDHAGVVAQFTFE